MYCIINTGSVQKSVHLPYCPLRGQVIKNLNYSDDHKEIKIKLKNKDQ